jgi:hypothetical protein
VKKCSAAGCDKKYSAKGLCASHYSAKQRADNPEYYKQKKREYWARDKVKHSTKRRAEYDHETAWAQRIQYNYGITSDDYYQLLETQRGCCAICLTDTPSSGRFKKFSVDHNHKTGKVRSLLCHLCNTGIGVFKENDNLLHRAIAYLKVHNECLS